jgi:hypothetical protein
MSVSMYSNQVSRLEKDIAALQKSAGQERQKAAKERQGAATKLRGISRYTSDSQRLGKEKDAALCEERAAKHDVKAAGFSDQAAKKGDQLQRARTSLQRAQASDEKREQTQRKRERDKELRELDKIEQRRRESQAAPTFEPQEISVGRGEVVRPRGEPINPRGKIIQSVDESDQTSFDVCLSFAGEQRSYVEMVARGLKEGGYRVFYDADEKAKLWGKNLAEHFDYVYRQASRVCVMFISAEYAEKPWTTHERRSALARALEEDEYVLPARFDDTELPGLQPTIGYIDLTQFAPGSLVDLLTEKLGKPEGS